MKTRIDITEGDDCIAIIVQADLGLSFVKPAFEQHGVADAEVVDDIGTIAIVEDEGV